MNFLKDEKFNINTACDKDGLTPSTIMINKITKSYLNKIFNLFNNESENKEDRKKNDI